MLKNYSFAKYTASATKRFYAENSQVLLKTEQTHAYSFHSKTFFCKATRNDYICLKHSWFQIPILGYI
jgi:hypothetical protein